MSVPEPRFTMKFMDMGMERVTAAQAFLRKTIMDGEQNPRTLAQSLKHKFDQDYGPTWHCIVGNSFGSMVSHCENGFLYFYVDNQAILLFKSS
ncbi:Dynein light chain [Aphelenchoides fujianensis]|nr:Dynein light chain [Aphelenchoides fujianensis]